MSGGAEILSNPYYASVPGGIGSPFYWVTFVFTILAAIIASQGTSLLAILILVLILFVGDSYDLRNIFSRPATGHLPRDACAPRHSHLVALRRSSLRPGHQRSSSPGNDRVRRRLRDRRGTHQCVWIRRVDCFHRCVDHSPSFDLYSDFLAVTTTFIAISIVRVKHLSIFTALAFLLVFGFIDALFWGASLKKIPEGSFSFPPRSAQSLSIT